MDAYWEAGLQRLVDAAVADAVAAGWFPAGPDLRRIATDTEAAAHLAALAGREPETVHVIGCFRRMAADGGLGDCVIRAREERTLARPEERLAVVVAAGMRREEALVRLGHIQAHLESLPAGRVLVPRPRADGADGDDHEADEAARLQAARVLVLHDDEAGPH
jgi:hypothetical protein